MIQQSINQLISTMGVAARLAPGYETRQEAREVVGRAKSAMTGIKDIESNLKKPDKEYTTTELNDIAARVAEHNKNVYSAKSMDLPGHPAQKAAIKEGVKDLPKQKEYGSSLRSIEQNLELKKAQALSRLKADFESSVQQDQEFKAAKDKVWAKFGGN